MSSAPQGLAPREGLELVLTKMGHTGPLLEPRCRPQAGKSGYPRSQNADRSNTFDVCNPMSAEARSEYRYALTSQMI